MLAFITPRVVIQEMTQRFGTPATIMPVRTSIYFQFFFHFVLLQKREQVPLGNGEQVRLLVPGEFEFLSCQLSLSQEFNAIKSEDRN